MPNCSRNTSCTDYISAHYTLSDVTRRPRTSAPRLMFSSSHRSPSQMPRDRRSECRTLGLHAMAHVSVRMAQHGQHQARECTACGGCGFAGRVILCTLVAGVNKRAACDPARARVSGVREELWWRKLVHRQRRGPVKPRHECWLSPICWKQG